MPLSVARPVSYLQYTLMKASRLKRTGAQWAPLRHAIINKGILKVKESALVFVFFVQWWSLHQRRSTSFTSFHYCLEVHEAFLFTVCSRLPYFYWFYISGTFVWEFMCVSYTNAEHKALSADFVQHLLWSGPSPSQTNTEGPWSAQRKSIFNLPKS